MIFSYTPLQDIDTKYDLIITVDYSTTSTPACNFVSMYSSTAGRSFNSPIFTCSFASNKITLKITDLKSKESG